MVSCAVADSAKVTPTGEFDEPPQAVKLAARAVTSAAAKTDRADDLDLAIETTDTSDIERLMQCIGPL